MKNLFPVLIFLLGFTCCSDSGVVIKDTDLPEDLFYLEDDIQPYSGICRIYYPGTEKVKMELSYEKGILDGPYTWYYPDGTIKISGVYQNGKWNGRWRRHDSAGKKLYEVHYKNDSLDGMYVTWYGSGVIKEKGFYSMNKKAGHWMQYDPSGMVLEERDY